MREIFKFFEYEKYQKYTPGLSIPLQGKHAIMYKFFLHSLTREIGPDNFEIFLPRHFFLPRQYPAFFPDRWEKVLENDPVRTKKSGSFFGFLTEISTEPDVLKKLRRMPKLSGSG